MQQQQFINNFNQLNMFRAIVSAILSSDAAGYQPAASSVFIPEAVKKNSLAFLRMGETIARNMLS
jgi:hypothetical protein